MKAERAETEIRTGRVVNAAAFQQPGGNQSTRDNKDTRLSQQRWTVYVCVPFQRAGHGEPANINLKRSDLSVTR